MACTIAKQDWDMLKETFQGNERTRRMQILNLKRDFEILKIEEHESIKQYSFKLMSTVNKIKLMGEELTDKRIVKKVLVSLPERFETKISSLEDLRDVNQMTLIELVSALQAQEQRKAIRKNGETEGAFQAKENGQTQSSGKGKKQF